MTVAIIQKELPSDDPVQIQNVPVQFLHDVGLVHVQIVPLERQERGGSDDGSPGEERP
eukprot:CAMPEP_0113590372 /NCGR_PEP_ID=MMETSP0015_2-20120614/36643_1 /TAXON_ID=2838 /ORGANISM="Odontella" /LENGTH=57 /DNA_ID=CAMNT_0000496567 /DNA_START=95 /DNA_END=264 /DNA_ORIENTATION=+ /assembly_acc=CAM_ASM_000160